MSAPVYLPVPAWPLLANPQHLVVNGVDLAEFGAIASSLSGLLTIPKRRGDNTLVAGRHGALHTPRKLYDQATIVLPLMVAATKADGSIPLGSSGREELHARIDDLTQLFSTDQVTLDHLAEDGSTRRLTAELIDVMSFTRNFGENPPRAEVKVALRAAYPFWVDQATVTSSLTVTTGGTGLLAEFAPSTAPIDQMVVTFVGPISNPTISVPATGVYLAYDGTLAAGFKLAVDTGAWSLSSADGVGWTPNYGALRHGGASGRWFELAPANPAPTARLTHTGSGLATVTVTGSNRYLIG